MEIVEHGVGAPLVFIPGWLATSAWWRPQMTHFGTGGPAVALDYGWGDGRTVDACAYGLRGALEDLPERAIVIGWSLGAAIALRSIELFGTAFIRGLVLVDQTPRSLPARDWPHGVIGLDEEMRAHTPALARKALPALAERVVPACLAATLDAVTRAELVAEAMRWSPDVAASLIEDHWSRDYRAAVAHVDVPTLLVAGDRSAFTPIGAMDYLNAAIPGSCLRVMTGCGHAPFFERPHEFNGLVEQFINTDCRARHRHAAAGAMDKILIEETR